MLTQTGRASREISSPLAPAVLSRTVSSIRAIAGTLPMRRRKSSAVVVSMLPVTVMPFPATQSTSITSRRTAGSLLVCFVAPNRMKHNLTGEERQLRCFQAALRGTRRRARGDRRGLRIRCSDGGPHISQPALGDGTPRCSDGTGIVRVV
jgi:hypothetical protein